MTNTPLDGTRRGGVESSATKPVPASPQIGKAAAADSSPVEKGLAFEHYASMVREVHALGNTLGPLISLTEVAATDARTPAHVRDVLVQCGELLAAAAGSTSRLSGLVRRLNPQASALSDGAKSRRPTIPANRPPESPLPRLRILCVEDDESVRTMLAKLLHSLGQSAYAVSSIAEALAAFDSETYDVVVTDLRLSGERGQDLTVQLRQKRPIPVIWITGFDDGRDLSLLEPDAAPTFLLQKPLSLEGLTHALRVVADVLQQAGRQ